MLGLRPPGLEFRILCLKTVSSQSSHHPQEVLLAQFSLYVHKGGLKPDSFHFISRLAFLPDWPNRVRVCFNLRSPTGTHISHMTGSQQARPNVVSMLDQRRRRWANIETTLGLVLKRHSRNVSITLDEHRKRQNKIRPTLGPSLALAA